MVKIGNSWDSILSDLWESAEYKRLRAFLVTEYKSEIIFPPAEDIFNALKLTPPEKIKAVIIGQDPYHRAGQAEGLCFSVGDGVAHPPSLQNIFKEISAEYGCDIPKSGSLRDWAINGVLLLNTVLTVREGAPQSHSGRGWEFVTDRIISEVEKLDRPIAYLLWGNNAISKKTLVTNKKHQVFTAPHPSPLSAHRGFFGCNHFKLCNEFLAENGVGEIDFCLN